MSIRGNISVLIIVEEVYEEELEDYEGYWKGVVNE